MANKPLDPKCPRCGGPCGKGGTTSHEHGKDGKQRWCCRDRKGCKWHGTEPIGLAKSESNGINAEHTKKRLNELQSDRSRVRGYVVTAAQNATAIYRPFFDSLLTYCKINSYELIVIPYRYKNPTSILASKDDDWWAPEIVPYLLDHRINLNPNIVVLGDIKTQPTASAPLQGFETLTGGMSAVIGHPKLELATIPTPQHSLPKILTTTGAVTKPNYIPSKAGKKGEHHHTFGACVVECNGKKFHMRQLNATKDGSFCDLTWKYSGDSREFAAVEALVMGDTHEEFVDPEVVKATFTGTGSIVRALKPKYLVWHDLHDFYARNHHHVGDPFIEYAKHRAGKNDVEAALDQTFSFVDCHSPRYATNVLVPSNHPDALARWVRESNPKLDPVNCLFWAKTFQAMCLGTTMTDAGASTIDPFVFWAKQKMKSAGRTVFLARDQSLQIRGIEVGYHGDRGANGSRGSRAGFGKIGTKTIVGHSHSPGIKDGVYQVGTSSRLRLGYNSGPSSWMHTHAIIYANGKRTLVNIVDSEWRA